MGLAMAGAYRVRSSQRQLVRRQLGSNYTLSVAARRDPESGPTLL